MTDLPSNRVSSEDSAPPAGPAAAVLAGESYRAQFLERIARRRSDLRAAVGAVLPSPRALVWEIGCGHGHFLVRYAEKFPEKYCLGVDVRLGRLERGDRKLHRAGVGNCHFLRAEAREFLLALPAGVTLEEVWVLFPDPWPKARHHKNRLLTPAFFEAMAARAGVGARFYFRTDHAEYFQEVAGFFAAGLVPTWQLVPGAPWPLEQETVFQARAPSYHSLMARRTTEPARALPLVAPGLPPPPSLD